MSIEVVGHVGIAQPQREAHSFYFDESTEQLIFNGMQPGIEALIMDASGRRLLESTTTESVLRIDMKGHTAGVYVARVRIGLDVHVQRFVKP